MCHVLSEAVASIPSTDRRRLQQSGLAPDTGVGALALSHLVPADSPSSRWRKAQQGFSGDLVVGEDLRLIPVGRARWTS